MSCSNIPPNPTREWSRVQNRCIFDTDKNTKLFVEKTLLFEMQKKGNILQYKKNSSNYTKNQIYSLMAQGKWLIRNKTYATQSERYTNPNTNHLRRINGQFIDLNTGQPTTQPICETKEPIIFDILPNVDPIQPDPILPDEIPVTNIIIPVIKNIDRLIVEDIIADNGVLICTQQENLCTGEIITTPNFDTCYSTTFSDVPYGKINTLCYKKEQLYYPKTRYTMNNSTNKWPYGSKLIRADFKSNVNPFLYAF